MLNQMTRYESPSGLPQQIKELGTMPYSSNDTFIQKLKEFLAQPPSSKISLIGAICYITPAVVFLIVAILTFMDVFSAPWNSVLLVVTAVGGMYGLFTGTLYLRTRGRAEKGEWRAYAPSKAPNLPIFMHNLAQKMKESHISPLVHYCQVEDQQSWLLMGIVNGVSYCFEFEVK